MQQPTHAPPGKSSTPTSAFGWDIAMWVIRPAAAATAAWSLYAVARHYHVPIVLAGASGLVYDGIAAACLYQATEAVRAARSAAAPILATLVMASTSVYLNLVHARLVNGGHPAAVLFVFPIIGLLALSAISWSADRAVAREARGESPMRMPAFGILGWVLAPGKAWGALRGRAVAHVTAAATPAHQPAPALEVFTAERIDPQSELPPAEDAHHAIGTVMHRDAPQLSGLSEAAAITTMARHLGGLDTAPSLVAHHLAQHGVTPKDGYVRTALSRARKAEQAEADAAAAEAAEQQAAHERRHGNGGYA